MKNIFSSNVRWIAPGAIALAAMLPGLSHAQNYEASLERGSRPDVTSEQRYQTAVREAGGGLKVALSECAVDPGSRRACEREARINYKEDMEYARNLRRNPDARPTGVRGGEIRTTEITTVRQIPAR